MAHYGNFRPTNPPIKTIPPHKKPNKKHQLQFGKISIGQFQKYLGIIEEIDLVFAISQSNTAMAKLKDCLME
jgi:hypothetical protein